MNREKAIEAVRAAICGDRQVAYGKPENNFSAIARYWTVHLKNRYDVDIALDSRDVAQMQILLKQARLDCNPTHLDSWIDAAGYALIGPELCGEDVE